MVRESGHDHVERKGHGDGDGAGDGAGEQAGGVRAEAAAERRRRERLLEAVVQPEDDGAAGKDAQHLSAVAAEVGADPLEGGDLPEDAIKT